MKDERDRDQNAPESRERRTTIKKLAVGVGALAGISSLPEKWTRPVVEGIVLPAHAQTSANLVVCREVSITLLSGTQASGTVVVRVQGCVTPAAAGVRVFLAVRGSQAAAAAAGTVPQEPAGLLERAVAAAGDLLVSEAVAADCVEIAGTAMTDAQGEFSEDFEIPCGPGIQSVYAYAALTVDRENGGYGSGVVSVPGETTPRPVDPPKPISPCSVGISNRLSEDITLIHDGTEHILSPGSNLPDLTIYVEPFSLTFRASTTSKKVLSTRTAVIAQFTDEVTVDDAVCGIRYTIGTL